MALLWAIQTPHMFMDVGLAWLINATIAKIVMLSFGIEVKMGILWDVEANNLDFLKQIRETFLILSWCLYCKHIYKSHCDTCVEGGAINCL